MTAQYFRDVLNWRDSHICYDLLIFENPGSINLLSVDGISVTNNQELVLKTNRHRVRLVTPETVINFINNFGNQRILHNEVFASIDGNLYPLKSREAYVNGMDEEVAFDIEVLPCQIL